MRLSDLGKCGWPKHFCVLLFALLAANCGWAQGTSASLSISINVQSSISLVFQNNPSVGNSGYCPLSNAGTNNVGLDFGAANILGSNQSCVAFSWVGLLSYQVASSFDVVVSKANTSSPNSSLQAKMSTTPPANVVWLVNNSTLGTSFT